MYARFLLFLGRPWPACGGRGSGFLACPAPDTAVPVRTRRRVEPAPAVMAMVVAGRWQIREARQHVCSVGAGRGTPAAVRVVGESGWGGGVPVCRKPGARVCRIKRVSVCPAVGRAVGCRYGCRPARKRRCGRMPGPPSAGCPACRDMRGSVNRTAPSVCRKGALAAGAGALPCLPAKMKGAPKGSLPHQKLTLKNYPLFGRPP